MSSRSPSPAPANDDYCSSDERNPHREVYKPHELARTVSSWGGPAAPAEDSQMDEEEDATDDEDFEFLDGAFGHCVLDFLDDEMHATVVDHINLYGTGVHPDWWLTAWHALWNTEAGRRAVHEYGAAVEHDTEVAMKSAKLE